MPQPILFRLRHNLPVLPVNPPGLVTPPVKFIIGGVTKDSSGVALAGVTVDLFRTIDNVMIDSAVSDGSGNYQFSTPGPGQNYYVVAYKAGAPDVAGTTLNTLTGIA